MPPWSVRVWQLSESFSLETAQHSVTYHDTLLQVVPRKLHYTLRVHRKSEATRAAPNGRTPSSAAARRQTGGRSLPGANPLPPPSGGAPTPLACSFSSRSSTPVGPDGGAPAMKLHDFICAAGPAGLGVEMDETNTVIGLVAGGNAEAQGLLRAGDVIIAVDGETLGGWQFKDVLLAGRAQHTLRVRRAQPAVASPAAALPEPHAFGRSVGVIGAGRVLSSGNGGGGRGARVRRPLAKTKARSVDASPISMTTRRLLHTVQV